jgi:hypothetical protein
MENHLPDGIAIQSQTVQEESGTTTDIAQTTQQYQGSLEPHWIARSNPEQPEAYGHPPILYDLLQQASGFESSEAVEQLSYGSSTGSIGPSSFTSLQMYGDFTSDVLDAQPQGICGAENLQLIPLLAESSPFSILWENGTSRSQTFPRIVEHSDGPITQNISGRQLNSPSGLLDRAQSPMYASTLPDPYKNFIWPYRTSLFSAGLRNAISLGITVNELMTTKFRSPFYRPTTPADDSRALVAAASNPLFPPNLQPTLPQILFPHYAFLDLCPFPLFRAKAIYLGAATPRLFDPFDLKIDVVASEGLKFIGAINGGGAMNGEPWDMRSWKIEPWFLKKWRMLFVEENYGFENG